ncbi:hypothetical protein Efla_007391 [Eimeria flavescens]
MKLSIRLCDRWKSSWTYKLQKYRCGPRWSLPRFLVSSPYLSPKFRRPPTLTRWGLPQQTKPTSSSSSSSSSKYCDMVKLHAVSGNHRSVPGGH